MTDPPINFRARLLPFLPVAIVWLLHDLGRLLPCLPESFSLSARKPVIGVAGGIGAGKTLVARQLEQLGAVVVDADGIAKALLDQPDVRRQLVNWWGDAVLDANGQTDRVAVAQRVFENPVDRQKLETLIHPLVAEQRDQIIADARQNPAITAIVVDAPLLFEVGWNDQCDHIIFIKADRHLRIARQKSNRGWDEAELLRREKIQLPLDKKLELAHYMVENNGSEAECLAQVRDVFSRILNTN